MNTGIKILLLSATLIIPFTTVQADDDYPSGMGGYGPGMMGGYGPGMMGGYGPGMMGGYGPGMMGGYGPGMMGGYGPGMMGGYGPGMMGSYYGSGIDLSEDQISKMQKIHSEAMVDMRPMVKGMWKAQNEMWKAMRSQDNNAISKGYDDMARVMKEMFLQRMKTQEKIQNILTKEQKERLNKPYSGMVR